MDNTTTEMRIIKNKAYNFTLIVKDVGASIPLILDPTDTATLYISTNERVPTLLLTKELTQGAVDADGKFIATLTAEETNLFPTKAGFKEDNKFMSTCRGTVSLTTVELGEGTIEIPKVTVVDVGL